MSDFKPIETQEELDRIIQDRLNRQKEKFSDYDDMKNRNTELEGEVTDLKRVIEESTSQIESHDKIVDTLNKKIESYEIANLRTKIAIQNGIPIDLADRLIGEDEKTIKEDAERLASMVSKKQVPPPLKNTEKAIVDDKDGAYKNLLQGINLEGE